MRALSSVTGFRGTGGNGYFPIRYAHSPSAGLESIVTQACNRHPIATHASSRHLRKLCRAPFVSKIHER